MKIGIYTLGCKVNQYETQAMEQELTARGHELVDFESPADAYIINTCSVTAVSDKKSRQMIRRAKKNSPDAVVAACGCYVQTHEEEAKSLGIDLLMGTNDRARFLDRLEEAVKTRETVADIDDALRRRTFEVLPAGGMANRTRAMLKVEDGCVNFCTYCIIPYARGPVRSLPLAEAVAQARALAEAGYREIVVTGIEIASWGWDLRDGSSFADLAEALCNAVPETRVRLGSLEPRVVDEAFCRRLAACPNLCPQFHLSLQSGSDTVLKRMHRKYDSARFFESVTLLRKFFPGCAVTTDLIVGFPGETEEEFAESVAFAGQCGFAAMHIFPYSRRAGTPADAMDGQIPKAVKAERAARAGQIAARLRETFDRALVGTVQEVLFEQREGEYFTGHAPSGVKVCVREEMAQNELRSVRIDAVLPDGVLGTPL